MLSIRLRRTGSKKRPFFRVVVSEARSKKEGEFIEVLGFYNPRTKPAVVEINKERITHWIAKGARPSDSVRTLLSKHLTRDRAVVATPASRQAAEPTAPDRADRVKDTSWRISRDSSKRSRRRSPISRRWSACANRSAAAAPCTSCRSRRLTWAA